MARMSKIYHTNIPEELAAIRTLVAMDVRMEWKYGPHDPQWDIWPTNSRKMRNVAYEEAEDFSRWFFRVKDP